MRQGAAILFSLSLFGCATAFRSPSSTVTIESTPPGADAAIGPRKLGATPTRVSVQRNATTQVTLTKSGHEDHHGVIKKQMNVGWITFDTLTCIIPITLCIPVLVDAISGAWYDIDEHYVAELKPGTPLGTIAAITRPRGTPPSGPAPASPPTSAPTPAPTPAMSESERKAVARAAYLEGIDLQEAGNCAEALPRFEAAQKLFSAPTHLLHIGQCQNANGKLVEAAETYETLVRVPLTKESPEVFHLAQSDGRKELARLKPRIPTLRVQITPAPSALSNLVVQWNGNPIPAAVLGIARPVNPGRYRVTVSASGYKEASETVDVGEGSAKVLELTLSR